MTKYLTSNHSVLNVHKKPNKRSEIVTQMIFGESFSILKKTGKWLKIKIREDNYKGYIKNKKFSNFVIPTHKIKVLKAKVYNIFNKRKKIDEMTFGSKIRVTDKSRGLMKFSKGWINCKDVVPITFKEKNFFKNITIFKNIRYKWGGKSFRGIDCSALIQIFLNFNNKFCPRDTKDQVKYFRQNIILNEIKKNDIIYWKGHVAVALSNKKLIHAYGPRKKVIYGDIKKTLKLIKRTANLKILKIKRL